MKHLEHGYLYEDGPRRRLLLWRWFMTLVRGNT